MLARLILFRKTGFNVEYVIEEYGKGGETSIGLITRNFAIKRFGEGRLVITLKPERSKLVIRAEGDPGHLAGRIVDLKTLMKLWNAYISINNDRVTITGNDLAENTLAYVVDAGPELAEYLSYTGEGAEIRSMSQSGMRYAVVFI